MDGPMKARVIIALWHLFAFWGYFLLWVIKSRRCRTWGDLWRAIRDDKPNCYERPLPTARVYRKTP